MCYVQRNWFLLHGNVVAQANLQAVSGALQLQCQIIMICLPRQHSKSDCMARLNEFRGDMLPDFAIHLALTRRSAKALRKAKDQAYERI